MEVPSRVGYDEGMNANQVKVMVLDPSTPAAIDAARQLTRQQWDEIYDALRSPGEVTDDDLIHAILGPDPAIARIAKVLFTERHRRDPMPPEPPHCSECFEGCPRCRPWPPIG
jgi:hypothetical protein